MKVLYFVDPRLQFSVFEDRRGVAGRVRSHGENKYDNAENTSRSRYDILSHTLVTRARHTFFVGRVRILTETFDLSTPQSGLLNRSILTSTSTPVVIIATDMRTFRIPDEKPDPRATWRSRQCGISTLRFRRFGCGICEKCNISCSGYKRPEKQVIPSQLQDGTIAAILRPSPTHLVECAGAWWSGYRPACPTYTTTCSHFSNTMFIFKDGKLRPGIYKIRNIVGQTSSKSRIGFPTTI